LEAVIGWEAKWNVPCQLRRAKNMSSGASNGRSIISTEVVLGNTPGIRLQVADVAIDYTEERGGLVRGDAIGSHMINHRLPSHHVGGRSLAEL